VVPLIFHNTFAPPGLRHIQTTII